MYMNIHALQVAGKLIYAMDALFGLPRKKLAGVSHRGPLHKDLFFYEQLPVDQFVMENSKKAGSIQTVSDQTYRMCVE